MSESEGVEFRDEFLREGELDGFGFTFEVMSSLEDWVRLSLRRDLVLRETLWKSASTSLLRRRMMNSELVSWTLEVAMERRVRASRRRRRDMDVDASIL